MSNGSYRKIPVKGSGGVGATVVITVYRGKVRVSIQPPFTWEAIMDPTKATELIAIITQAVREAQSAYGQQELREGEVV